MIETLLAPISADAPCGPDLEYDADFLALQRCATARPEEQYGDVLIAGQSPAWREAERLALELLARTKDLRIVVPLTWAWLDSRGLQGYADGLRLAAALLDAYWEPLHPALVVEGEADPLPRFNTLAELAGPQGCVRLAREQPLLGTLSVSAAAELIQQGEGGESGNPGGNLGGNPAGNYAGGRERFVHELRAAFAAGDPVLLAALAVREQLAGLRRRVSERLGDAWTLDASAFERQLAALAAVIAPDMAQAQAQTQPQTQEASQATPDINAQNLAQYAAQASQGLPPPQRAAGPPAANGAAWRDAEISSRADIDFGLEKMCRYLELHEPSHPAPIFLRRAQRLLSLNFYEIFRDIAPESVRELEHLSGNRNETPQ
ncbi:type VI secretion system protein TssA [Paraburkholderia silviterrae]|uniref:Type VI secretion system protein TssA n=1 Tax=Paraburkholderia silviterrae TaxID=2528715 RepID=A0A4R5M6Z7_9BURK|nr:type VI secretion system protein TssA [Paraburkholderia silviterrae]TDG21940.1 type VI secretion system protein TssA [Paraburkholderia silviterrae]